VENDVVMNGNVILHINQEYMIGFVGNEFLLNEVYYGVYHGQASDNHPVTGVTFYGAIEYCDWLSAITGLEPFYNGNLDNNEFHNPYLSNGYRLPTSAEWEYADQYNDHRIYPWGDFGPLPEIVNAHQWYGGTTPVGSFPDGSGLLGIMDMAGNVWEYCNDWSYDYTTDSVIDPIGPEFGTSKIYKGGSWLNTQGNYMYSCSFRVIGSPISFADATHGFRICKTIR
ncbi:MAG: SUMF1/EgtB/PvdO family nonheme iron enzyme, partial [bacterium]|nr:SUMF1/EgtB/PvdO family nonheme iron enzyme [bacterium]